MLNLGQDGGGGASGSDLNKELGQQTAAGKSLFGSPFGDKTVYHDQKNGGVVLVMFTFDPDKPYNSSFSTASIVQDYWGEIRRNLTKLLLSPKDIKPIRQTRDESVWGHLRRTLPNHVFKEYFSQNPGELGKYVAILQKEARQDYDEEVKLTEAMSTDFKFSFDIAIDAYPTKLSGNAQKKSTDIPYGRKGVLTFYIQGISKATLEADNANSNIPEFKDITAKKRKMDIEGEDDSEKDDVISDLSTPMKHPTLHRVSTELPRKAQRSNESKKRWSELQKKLGINDAWCADAKHVAKKEFMGAAEFFEDTDKWFNACISTTALTLTTKESQMHNLYN